MPKTLAVDPLEQDQWGSGSVRPPESWFCVFCERENRWQDYECRDCERPRYYQLTQRQARAVARKLNSLEIENEGLSAMLAAGTLFVSKLGRENTDLRRQLAEARSMVKAENSSARNYFAAMGALYDVQPCGHEARFGLGSDEGTNWCALCALKQARAAVSGYRQALGREEATDEVP